VITGNIMYFAGGANVRLCGILQYLDILGIVIGYTIAASISMM